MQKFLYNLCFHIDNAQLEGGYCIDERDLSASDIKSEDEDNRFEVFEKMISTHSSFYNKEWQCITDIEIEDKLACSFTHNRYLPNSFFKSLLWFNKAIQQYTDLEVSQEELQNSISEISSLDCCRSHSWEKIKETTIIHTQCYYMLHFHKRMSYCENVIREIVKLLNLSAIESYDRIIQSHKEELGIVRPSYDECIVTLQTNDNIDNLKNNLIYNTERVALEIVFILGELNACLRHSLFGFDIIKQASLKETMLFFKKRLIIERKKHEIEHKEIAVTLADIKSEKSVAIDKEDKETIICEIFPAFKNREKGMQMLNEIDKSRMISTTFKFPKKELGILIHIMYCSKLVQKQSFEIFKQRVCTYYGKEDISTKPNKTRQEAISEYTTFSFRYKEYDIDLDKLKGKREKGTD